jgi:serine-type D-Ala-D-Ala carboxypeptidase (penicillin-binding protein 5/6)
MLATSRFLLTSGACLILSHAALAQVAAAYALADHTTGHVLESYKGETKRSIGSLTKIATAKVVLDWAAKTNTDLAQQVVVPPLALSNAGGVNPMGLQPNDLITYRALIYAALLQSDNSAASILAFYVGADFRSHGGPELSDLGPIEAFVAQMNALARQLGMERTLFVNPHGLEPRNGLQPYSTALDLAKLSAYAMKDAGFRFYVSQKERKISFSRSGQNLEYLLRNTNELVGTDGIDGVKTGRTNRAGDCIIISAQREAQVVKEGDTSIVTPRRITVVVLGAADRFAAARQLLPRAWALYDQWAATGRPMQPVSR